MGKNGTRAKRDIKMNPCNTTLYVKKLRNGSRLKNAFYAFTRKRSQVRTPHRPPSDSKASGDHPEAFFISLSSICPPNSLADPPLRIFLFPPGNP
jgi:hypothetical protein